jgi:tol-pal system protein YbgF
MSGVPQEEMQMATGLRRILTTGLLLAVFSLPLSVQAQSKDETLADIRQEMEFLYADIQGLRRELSTTEGTQVSSANGPALQRLDALEQELRRVTGVIEQMQFRIDRIVRDGTNRIGDLEFRLVELEGGDVLALGKTTTLGGDPDPVVTPPPVGDDPRTAELAVSEQGDFDRAYATFENGDFASASSQFQAFTTAYPDGPLSGDAYFWRGESLAELSDWSNAARSYLESFSGSPQGTLAPNALYRLGVSLAKLGQSEEACLTLAEVENRYPGAGVVSEAISEMQALGCT